MPEQIQETAVSGNVKTSKSAIWSLVLGIIGIPLCLLIIPGILAVIFGIIGLVKIKKSAGTLKGTGLAIAGLILGGLITIISPFIIITDIAIVAAIAIPSYLTARGHAIELNEFNKTEATKSNIQDISAKTDISNIGSALELYKMDSGYYPSNEQGIQVLINNKQKNSYIDNIPDDPWGRPYQYRYPGKNNKDSFDLWSPGADGEDGTPDDITNWQNKPC